MELTHVRLLVDDFVGCFRFYRDVLGLPTRFPDEPPYAEFELGGGKYLGLFDRELMAEAVDAAELPSDAAVRDRVALAFTVEDVNAERERLDAAGIAIVAEPTERPEWGLRTLHVRDPDGNLIELSEPMEVSS